MTYFIGKRGETLKHDYFYVGKCGVKVDSMQSMKLLHSRFAERYSVVCNKIIMRIDLLELIASNRRCAIFLGH